MSKSTHWRSLAGGGLVVAACSLAACSSSSPRPGATELQNGLNLLDIRDATWGVNAAYLKAGRVIYIETRVGPLKPEIYRQDAPDEPSNEMDFRFVDSNNRTFFVQRGGDSYVDPAWSPEIAKSLSKDIPAADRAADYDLAQEAATAMGTALPPAFKDHAFHMIAFARQPSPMKDAELQQHIQEFDLKSPRPAALPAALGDTGYQNYNSYSWTQIYTAKYSGSTGCFAWVCAASHSATVMYVNPNVGYWQLAISANNHGRAYNASGMGYDCYSWNGGGWFQYGVSLSGSTASTNTNSGDGQGGCQTAYNWNSGGYDHLCNDDAAYELWQTKNGNQGSNSVTGTSGGNLTFQYYGAGHCDGDACGSNPASYACNCGSFNGCSGDWNTPICP